MADPYKQYMQVWLDRVPEMREIVELQTNQDLFMEVLGLEALSLSVTTIYPVPQMNEGEIMERTMDGKVIIYKVGRK